MRISIEVTDTQHKILKANAALQGQSLKEYVLERTIPTPDEETALKELEAFMRPSVEAVYRDERSDQTFPILLFVTCAGGLVRPPPRSVGRGLREPAVGEVGTPVGATGDTDRRPLVALRR